MYLFAISLNVKMESLQNVSSFMDGVSRGSPRYNALLLWY